MMTKLLIPIYRISFPIRIKSVIQPREKNLSLRWVLKRLSPFRRDWKRKFCFEISQIIRKTELFRFNPIWLVLITVQIFWQRWPQPFTDWAYHRRKRRKAFRRFRQFRAAWKWSTAVRILLRWLILPIRRMHWLSLLIPPAQCFRYPKIPAFHRIE